jgi:hypothetical protein
MADRAYSERVEDFLAQKRIAVCGLSRTKESGASAIYLKLREHGYQVFAVHPRAESLNGDRCYPSLSAIPDGVDGVFIMNSPDISEQIVREAASLGVQRVWMHNNTLMASSASEDAIAYGEEHGMDVISVGCPLMFLEPDFGHSCIHWVARAMGRMPA